jgi:parvulin-like peptidyl-prolyl isomerase
MNWHRLVLSGLVSAGLAGCAATSPSLHGVQRLQMDEKEANPQPVARTQPPRTPPVPILDQSPEIIPPEVGGVRVTSSIRAMVNNVPILDEEVRDACYPSLMDLARSASVRRMSPQEIANAQVQILTRELQELVERELILQECYARLKGPGQKFLEKLKEAAGKEFDKQTRGWKEKANCKTDEELREFMRKQGLSLAGMRRQFERKFIASQYVRSRLEPNIDRNIQHEQIREYYDKHPEEFQTVDGVTWLDIFIDLSKYADRQAARQFADLLVQRGREGEDFVKLSGQYDQGISTYSQGEGFGHRHGEIRPPEAEPILFGMKEGDIRIIELANGFHVIKLTKREYNGLLPLNEKTQTRIREKLKDEALQREYKHMVNDLRHEAHIEYAKTTPQ